MAKIYLTPTLAKRLTKLPAVQLSELNQSLSQITHSPESGQVVPFIGKEEDKEFRLARAGNLRVVYRYLKKDDIVMVTDVISKEEAAREISLLR